MAFVGDSVSALDTFQSFYVPFTDLTIGNHEINDQPGTNLDMHLFDGLSRYQADPDFVYVGQLRVDRHYDRNFTVKELSVDIGHEPLDASRFLESGDQITNGRCGQVHVIGYVVVESSSMFGEQLQQIHLNIFVPDHVPDWIRDMNRQARAIGFEIITGIFLQNTGSLPPIRDIVGAFASSVEVRSAIGAQPAETSFRIP